METEETVILGLIGLISLEAVNTIPLDEIIKSITLMLVALATIIAMFKKQKRNG